MKISFVFVCQQGELEPKALLLAASLRRSLRGDVELVAAIPRPASLWGEPAPRTLRLLQALGVRQVPIENPIGREYPIGNKLAALGAAATAGVTVFLDSDMLCLGELPAPERFAARALHAKPADLRSFEADDAEWLAAYAACGVPMTTAVMEATVSGDRMRPYFNAGFLAVPGAAELAREWIACARAIDADPAVPHKRPWLDQVALPVAAARLGLPHDCLDERYNFPAHLKPLSAGPPPAFVHYHGPEVIRREPVLNARVHELAAAHPDLAATLDADPRWAALLRPHADGSHAATDGRTPELLVTGFPRSGTSYLCRLIHDHADCVVINEPVEIFEPLRSQPVPWAVALHHRELRRHVRDGQPVLNKLRNGEFIEDTAQGESLEPYLPKVGRPDFLVATKNTLAYLSRLPQLRRALPQAAIAACVRHPLDTIASWKRTFAHLRSADMEAQRVGFSDDPQLAGWQRERLRELAACGELPRKRALLWRYLAEVVLANRDRVVLLRYEDVVADPQAAVARVFAAVPGGFATRPLRPLEPSAPRLARDGLDAADREAIGAVCTQAAAELGYTIA